MAPSPLAIVALGLAFGLVATSAEASRVRVHGSAHIDGHAGRAQEGHALVMGRLLDDAGLPVPNARFAVAAPSAPSSACGDVTAPAPTQTDESGRFCVWLALPLPPRAYSVHVDVPATDWLAATSADYAVDLSKRSVELRFDPEPRIVLIDDGANAATLDAVATLDELQHPWASRAEGASGLPLELSTETGDVVARATTDASGRATFEVHPRKLGPPGPGALRVRFAGSTDTMASEHVATIERHVRVSLTATDVGSGSSEDGIPIDVQASAASGTPTGTVEVRVDGVLVGAAQLEGGKASVAATFASSRRASIAAQIHYVPDRPWLQPGADLPVTLDVHGPSPWRQAPLALCAVAIAAWLLVGRSARRARLDRTIVMTRPPMHEGTAGISVVQSSRSRTGRFAGRVLDAHDGSPIARARLAVVPAGFSVSDAPVVSVFADEQGSFEFELTSPLSDAQLVVEGPLHVQLRQKLPVAGVLEIALVARRRALLDRLVQWARRRGAPFDQRPEPTPAQVRRAAERAMPEAVAWANAVERAAFDKGEVDARAEQEVMALDPDNPRRL